MLFAGTLGVAWVLSRAFPLPWPGGLPARIAGYGLGAGGIALSAWALVTLARAHTNLLPHRAADRLVTGGPYRIWRHPFYMGEVLILLGIALASLSLWFAILAPLFALAVYGLAVRPEERHLEARFGAEYEAYKARTRRWF